MRRQKQARSPGKSSHAYILPQQIAIFICIGVSEDDHAGSTVGDKHDSVVVTIAIFLCYFLPIIQGCFFERSRLEAENSAHSSIQRPVFEHLKQIPFHFLSGTGPRLTILFLGHLSNVVNVSCIISSLLLPFPIHVQCFHKLPELGGPVPMIVMGMCDQDSEFRDLLTVSLGPLP
jgi:hypothetical protein